MMKTAPVILASSSPQRKRLLEGLGVSFEIVPSTIDEAAHGETDPAKRAVSLAREKALDVAKHRPGCIVIGCDTLVVASDGTLLEKPVDAADARRMLMLQSDATSVVHSGLVVIDEHGGMHEGISSSDVRFRTLDQTDIDRWIASGLWKDRSGSFQIDGLGQSLIEEIRGDWTGIVGLPLFLLGGMLEEAGIEIL